jgi:uncharacterized repeat protein (TIGR01451 family)
VSDPTVSPPRHTEIALQRLPFAFVLAVLVAVLGTTAADARPSVSLKLQADLVTRDDKGAQKLVPVPEGSVLKPGDEVRYIIVATNAGPSAATHLVPQGKIPKSTSYEIGSASRSDALRVEFSIDGGKTWSVKPMVMAPSAAGPVEKPADVSLYTMLRWIGASPLAPNTSKTYTYQVRIK